MVGVAAELVMPFGCCRQRLSEFADAAAPVWVADLQDVRARMSLGELLLHRFGVCHLPY